MITGYPLEKEYLTVGELITLLKGYPEELKVYYAIDKAMYEGKEYPVYEFLDFKKVSIHKVGITQNEKQRLSKSRLWAYFWE